jgi:hypothetical protein
MRHLASLDGLTQCTQRGDGPLGHISDPIKGDSMRNAQC